MANGAGNQSESCHSLASLFCNGLKKEMESPLPRSRQAAMLCLMRSYFRNRVCLPLPDKIYRCKHETFHQLQACRIAQAGGS